MSTLTTPEAVEFITLTDEEVASLNAWDLNVYTTLLLKQEKLSWSGRIWGEEEVPQQFARIESRFTQTKYKHHE